MLDAIFTFLSEVVAFYLGRFYLQVMTLGRYKADIQGRHAPMVSLFGGIVTFAIVLGCFAWLNAGV